ncbi:MAG TPA: Gfo/Idh/MocA family oxidoreductase [Candidatus Aminicenantes bacterium]|nr:Gfo/Idh/MocA family oxidoreductase [Acidobacteriota bacterium]HPN17568.1 Gfo/Idh/MocA family oxidoreductase [Candidatus Aminicenantes bacterium]
MQEFIPSLKRFALIGAAGYIAPRHLKAIKDTGNVLVAAMDKSDSVGVLDSYFPGASFFTEFERFDRFLEKLRRADPAGGIDCLSIATPNYLHDAHIRFALRLGASAICEKPVVLNPWNLDALKAIEAEYGRKVYTVLQMRLHPALRALKSRVETGPAGRVYDVELTNVTARGRWYFYSWKGDEAKSGGVATNIGIHFFDVLTWIFGEAVAGGNIVHLKEPDRAAGFLELRRARIRWYLSLRAGDVPAAGRARSPRAFRRITVDGEPADFTEGCADLHSRVYEEILAGRGFGLEENRRAVEIVHDIRQAAVDPRRGERHPLL